MSSEANPRLLEVGRIGRAHGLRGDVVVDLTTDRTMERTAPGAELWIADRKVVVAVARPHQQKWLVRFEGVEDRTAAESLRGRTLSAERCPPALERTGSSDPRHRILGLSGSDPEKEYM